MYVQRGRYQYPHGGTVNVLVPPEEIHDTTNWSVLTAGPAAGKTTTLNGIAACGYRVKPEIARLQIDNLISDGRDTDEIVPSKPFEQAVISNELNVERQFDSDEHVFCDRSLIDAVAYCEHFDVGIDFDSLAWFPELVRDRYNEVFVLEQLPMESDYARHENTEEASAVHQHLIDTYERFGYDPIHVPIKPLQDRVGQILDIHPMDTPIRDVPPV